MVAKLNLLLQLQFLVLKNSRKINIKNKKIRHDVEHFCTTLKILKCFSSKILFAEAVTTEHMLYSPLQVVGCCQKKNKYNVLSFQINMMESV